MKLICYTTEEHPMQLVPGRPDRPWMDATNQRFAYRCLPLSIANATGWEILCPCAFEASWNGENGIDDLKVRICKGEPVHEGIMSHFGHGVLTFTVGYLFRTERGWAIWARGAPNWPKDGIAPLDGLIETDWAPFPFTMNWRFTRPGRVSFERNEPVCFITPIPHLEIEKIEVETRPITDDQDLDLEFRAWSAARLDFNREMADRNLAAIKEGWQRFYIQGTTATGRPAGPTHRAKRRLAAPKVVSRSDT